MTDTDQTRTGGCRCGAVRYRAVGKPKWVAHCHCKDCRKQTSAGYATWLGYETTAVTWAKGAPKQYASSPGVERGFCANCGTPLCFVGQRWGTRMPRTHGNTVVPQSKLAAWVESDRPLHEQHPEPKAEVTEQIGEIVAGLIEDGSTLQMGIGAVPDAVLARLGMQDNGNFLNFDGKPLAW